MEEIGRRTGLRLVSLVIIAALTGSLLTMATLAAINPEQENPLTSLVLNNDGFAVTQPAFAAGLKNVFALPSNNLFNAESYYTVMLTTASSGAIKSVTIQFPPGFNVASAKLIEVSGFAAGKVSVSGQTVTYTVAASPPPVIAANTPIKIMLAKIINKPASASENFVTVTTKNAAGTTIDGPSQSAIFSLVQVTNAMLATNSVTTPKIAADAVSRSKIADDVFNMRILPDDGFGNDQGWDPDGSETGFTISELSINSDNSMIFVQIEGGTGDEACTAHDLNGATQHFRVSCQTPPLAGVVLKYIVINP